MTDRHKGKEICKQCGHEPKYHDRLGCHHSYGLIDNHKVCLCLRFKGIFWGGGQA